MMRRPSRRCSSPASSSSSPPRPPARGRRRLRVRAPGVEAGRRPIAGARRIAALHLLSALAAPLIRLGLAPTAAFTILNGLLLVPPRMQLRRACTGPGARSSSSADPLVALDKPHTEPFHLCDVRRRVRPDRDGAGGGASRRRRGGTQNPGNGLAGRRARRRRVRRPARPAEGPAVLAGARRRIGRRALHPAYYLARLGTLTPLTAAADVRLVTARGVTSPCWLIPNVGLDAGRCPLLRRRDRRRAAPDLPLAAPPGVARDHGRGGLWACGSRSWPHRPPTFNRRHARAERYATWFIPLAIPLFTHWTAHRTPCRVDGRAALASAALGVWAFNPAGRKRWTGPPASRRTVDAASVDRQSATEIFAERLRGLDENWLPVATAGCEKVLLPGRGGRDSVWPCRARRRRRRPAARWPRHLLCQPHRVSLRVRGAGGVDAAGLPARAFGDVAALGRAVRGGRPLVARVVEHARVRRRRCGLRGPVVAPRGQCGRVAGIEPVLRAPLDVGANANSWS